MLRFRSSNFVRITAFAIAVFTIFTAPREAFSDELLTLSPGGSHDWSGPYIGGHIGGAWLEGRDQTFPGGGIDGDGVIGGGLIGFNLQVDNVVFGVEGDVSFGDLDAANGVAGFIQDFDLKAMGTIRGRVGYAINRFLVFGTAGFAVADFEATHRPGAVDRDSETHTGYTVGGGVEWNVWENVSIRAEYQYVEFGDETYGFFAGTDPHNISVDELHVVRGAIVWRFGSLFGR